MKYLFLILLFSPVLHSQVFDPWTNMTLYLQEGNLQFSGALYTQDSDFEFLRVDNDGNDGKYLTVESGYPVWKFPAAGAVNEGDLIYRNSTEDVDLPIGGVGEVLIVGDNGQPEWGTVTDKEFININMARMLLKNPIKFDGVNYFNYPESVIENTPPPSCSSNIVGDYGRTDNFPNGVHVVICYDGSVYRGYYSSDDGANWTQVPSQSFTAAGYIKYGKSTFVYIIDNGHGTAFTTTTVTNWTLIDVDGYGPTDGSYPNLYKDIDYGNNVFVAVAAQKGSTQANRIVYSSDGTNWNFATEPATYSSATNLVPNKIKFINDNFYILNAPPTNSTAFNNQGNEQLGLLTSNNGINWTNTERPTDNVGRRIDFLNLFDFCGRPVSIYPTGSYGTGGDLVFGFYMHDNSGDWEHIPFENDWIAEPSEFVNGVFTSSTTLSSGYQTLSCEIGK